jgi:hypothetical protein
MLSLERILIDGALFILVMGALVLLSLVVNPRIWLQDYPTALRQLAPPLTSREKRQRSLFALPLLLGFIVIPYLSTRAFASAVGESANFLTFYLHAFALFNLFNLFDAVVLDWLFLGMLRPKALLIREALEHPELVVDNRKMVIDYFKGIAFCVVGALVIASAVWVG